jgi:hypothetical protein
MTAAPFDTLKLSPQLRERAHFDQQQAEGFAEAFQEPFEGNIKMQREQSR